MCVDCTALQTMLGHWVVVLGGRMCFGVCVLRTLSSGVCRSLSFNDITTISSGTFEGLESLTSLCAQRWCGENGAVWGVE